MSCCASTAANGQSSRRACGRPPRALEIIGVVFAFITFWPLAVAYLVWKFMGYPMPDNARASFERTFERIFGRPFQSFQSSFRAASGRQATGNSAFEEYRRHELERLEQERRRLDEEAQAFSTFVDELKRAKDREEFDAFMAKRRNTAS